MDVTEQQAAGASAGDWVETPHYVPAGAEHVFGVLTRPTRSALGTALLFLHAGVNFSAHRNAMWSSLAREAAAEGYPGLRIDYHGSGDSSGVLVHRGLGGQTGHDIDACVEVLTGLGAQRVIVVGTCWGGMVGLEAALRKPQVRAVYLISSPMHLLEQTRISVTVLAKNKAPATTAIARLLAPRILVLLAKDREYRRWIIYRVRRRWTKDKGEAIAARGGGGGAAILSDDAEYLTEATELYPQLSADGVVLKALFGDLDQHYEDMSAPHATPVLDAYTQMVETVVVPNIRIHGFASLASQELVRKHVMGWLSEDAVSQRP